MKTQHLAPPKRLVYHSDIYVYHNVVHLPRKSYFNFNYFQVHYDKYFKISPYKFMTDIWGKIYYAVHLHKGAFSGFYFDDKMPYIDIVVQFHLATLMVGCTRSV